MIRQHTFYMDDEDWVKIRHHCLDAGISVTSFIERSILAAIGLTPKEHAQPPIRMERPFTPAPKPSQMKKAR